MVEIVHALASAKSQGPDDTLVSKNAWNAAHRFQMSTGTLLGRTTASLGDFEEITPNSADFFFTNRTLAIGPRDSRAMSADVALSNISGAQAIITTAPTAFFAAASTTYLFEALFHISRSAGTTAHTVDVGITASAAVNSIRFLVKAANPTGNTLSAVSSIVGEAINTAYTFTTSNNSATENLIIRLNGIVRTSSAAGFAPFVSYSAAPGGVPTCTANSFMRWEKLGVDTFTFGGAWS